MEKGKKRKRNLDLPRITYHASDRTFERLFKEESLEEMVAVVRRKLGLPENASISLTQFREGKPIDLEDNDDFDAFYSTAHSTSSVNVKATVTMDTTPSSNAPKKVPNTNTKTKTNTVCASNDSLEHPNSTEHEQIVAEDITLSRATTKEADTRELGLDVRSEGDNVVVERTRKPCKKRRKDGSRGIAACATSSCPVPSSSNLGVVPELSGMNELEAPSASQIDGNEHTVLAMISGDWSLPADAVPIPDSPITVTNNESSRRNRNVRHKKRHKDSQSLLFAEPTSCSAPILPTEGNSTTKMLSKRRPKSQGIPLAEQLAGAISETAEHNQKQLDKLLNITRRQVRNRKGPYKADDILSLGKYGHDNVQNTSLGQHSSVSSGRGVGASISFDVTEPAYEGDATGADKKSARCKTRASTVDDLEAANADVMAAFSRILAAKRAPRGSSPAGNVLENMNISPHSQHTRHSEAEAPQPTPNGRRDTASHGSSKSFDVSEDRSRRGPTTLPIVPTDASPYADIDLDALIRGPNVSAKILADIPATGSSEDEEDLELAEDDGERQSRRRGGRFVASDTSEDGDMDDDDDDNVGVDNGDASPTMDFRDSSPLPHEDYVSFQMLDRPGESPEVGNSGDVAFHAALSADTVVFQLADHKNPSPLSDYTANIANVDMAAVQPSQNGVCSTDPPNPESNSKVSHPSPLPWRDDVSSAIQPESVDRQRQEGIIRRMKGRGGKCVEKNSVAGIPNENGRTQSDSQQAQEQANGRDIAVAMEPATSSQHGISLDTWTTLKESSPFPGAESTIMIDELRSSSPSSQVQMGAEISNSNSILTSSNPLFILTESQPPFPYSQWNGEEAANDSEDEQKLQPLVKPQTQSRIIHPPRYRRLTDIASQKTFFPPATNTKPARISSNKLADMYGRSQEEDIESDSDTDSDSGLDAQVPKSHIPKSRIAGVSRQSR